MCFFDSNKEKVNNMLFIAQQCCSHRKKNVKLFLHLIYKIKTSCQGL